MTAYPEIIATLHPSGFERSDSNFYSLGVLRDGLVYYTLCSHHIDTHGRVYRYDPAGGAPVLFADLGEVTGEKGARTLPQGKSHAPILEAGEKIYIATHYGYYQGNEGKEEPAPPPPGYGPYPGGKLLEYDRARADFRILAAAPPGEGIITMSMDPLRGVLYSLTWPRGLFLRYDIEKSRLENLGPVSRGGEVGQGDRYLCLCRGIAVDPRDGAAYFTNADGEILVYRPQAGRVFSVEWAHMRRDIFGVWDPHRGGHQGYNWRQILWHPGHGCFYGVHGKSGFLFRFDPLMKRLDILRRICNEQCIRDGAFEHFRYGYMTLAADPADDDILYYISGFESGRQDGTPAPRLSLTTYRLGADQYADHGVLRLADGRYPTLSQAIAVHPGGRIYTCPWIPRLPGDGYDEHTQQCDLVSFPNPLRTTPITPGPSADSGR